MRLSTCLYIPALAVLATGVAAAANDGATPPPRFSAPFKGGMGLGLVGALGAELDFTAEQKEAADALRDDFEDAVAPLLALQRDRLEEMRAELESEEPDPFRVGTLMIEADAIARQIEELRGELGEQFRSLLDADQLERWKEMESLRAERGPMPLGLLLFGQP